MSHRDVFLQAALPPSDDRTGKTAEQRPSGAGPLVQVQPVLLNGRRGVRKSFWGAAPCGSAVGVLRQKVHGPTPYRCLVPSAGAEGNCNDRTSRRCPEGKRVATRYDRYNRTRKNRKAHGARLDKRGHIGVHGLWL